MKQLFLILVCIPVIAFSQNCQYDQRIFTSYIKHGNVVYGNAPGIPSIYLGESFTTNQNLTADIFEPSGDVSLQRPLIIFSHSGGFINGSKNNQDMQALCDSFTMRGYVTASINYRLNFNLLSSSSAERAVWRGTQDASTAVRFFKANAALYKIDTTKIFFWGSSAGSFMALHLAYMDDAERPASTHNSPDLGCKDCTGLVNGSSSKVAGIISCWGAIGDTSWISNANNTPCQLFHGTADGSVPYIQGSPFGLGTLPSVHGSKLINDRLSHTTIYHEFYPAAGEDHEYWGTSNGSFTAAFPTHYWQEIIDKAKIFMIGRMGLLGSCGPLAVNFIDVTAIKRDNGSVLLTWATAEQNEVGTYFTAEYSRDGRSWNTAATQRVSTSGQSRFSATHVIDANSLRLYYRIRGEEPNGHISYSRIVSLRNNDQEGNVDIYPNPANEVVTVRLTNQPYNVKATGTIYTTAGMQIRSFSMNSIQETIPVEDLAAGVYIIKISSEKMGTIVSRLFINR